VGDTLFVGYTNLYPKGGNMLKEMLIKETFTYDKSTDEIGWLHLNAHSSNKPTVHKGKYKRPPYCVARNGKHCAVTLIKEVLG